MKSVNVRELLTAAVDGELTPAERKAAQRLLRESETARVLFAQLKADAARLKKLPRVAAPADLADNVLGVINDRALTPTPLPPSPRADRKFNWGWLPIGANVAAAAGVLVAITLGSYLYFSASQDYYASLKEQESARVPAAKPRDVIADRPAGDPVPPRDRATDWDEEAVVDAGPPVPEVGPAPREVELGKGVLTSPVEELPEIEPFLPDKIRLSQLVKLDELAADAEARKRLATEMKKDELIRLDLFCTSTPKALQRVTAALKSRGIRTLTDGFAADRLKRKVPTELMIFTETLTTDEVAQLLTALGAEDRKSGAGQFDTLVAAPFLGEDLVKLGRLLGIPHGTLKHPKAKVEVDIRKPLPEGTADHVARTLSGMGGGSSPRPKAERLAMVVAYSPANGNPSGSKEIRQFVERRDERKADAKPLMLVLKVIPK